ncbi:MAG: Bbp16 family capsid cement protein [Pseudomonadota bacterium]
MHLDQENLFSDAQAITADGASTNIINLGQPGTVPHAPAPQKQDIGGSNGLNVLVQVVEDFVGGTSLTVRMERDDTSAFSSPDIVAESATIPVASLKEGKILPLTIVPPGVTGQYLRLFYDVAGSPSAGKVTAGITTGLQTNV